MIEFVKTLIKDCGFTDYTTTEIKIMALCSTIGTVLSFLLGGFDSAVIALIVLIVADYATGMLAAWKTGALASQRGYNGIKRKIMMLVIVAVATQIDNAMSMHVLRQMVIFAYAGNEGLSILENLDRMGYGEYIPGFVREKLIQLRDEKGLKV